MIIAVCSMVITGGQWEVMAGARHIIYFPLDITFLNFLIERYFIKTDK